MSGFPGNTSISVTVATIRPLIGPPSNHTVIPSTLHQVYMGYREGSNKVKICLRKEQVCGPGIIDNTIPVHFQNCIYLNDKLDGHPSLDKADLVMKLEKTINSILGVKLTSLV